MKKSGVVLIGVLLLIMSELCLPLNVVDASKRQTTTPADPNQGRKRDLSSPQKPQGADRRTPEEESNDLIVVVRGNFDGQDTYGAGIVFGETGNRVYIATANHVVRRDVREAQNLQVEFRWLPGEPIEATLLTSVDALMDLAVLVVDEDKHKIPLNKLKFDQLGDSGSIKRADSVYLVGHPGGRLWLDDVTPDKVSRKSANSIYIESPSIAVGYSGGGLLNERRELIGMIKADSPPEGIAVSIDAVEATLKEWGYPVKWSRSSRSPVPADPNVVEQRQEIEKIVADFLAAWLSGDADSVIRLSSTPFYNDNEILVRLEDLRIQYEALYKAKGHLAKNIKIVSLRTQTIAELKREIDARRDRVLGNLFLRDDDFAVIVLTQTEGGPNEGTLYFLRKTSNGWRIAGLWG
jgi:hypothetical protein